MILLIDNYDSFTFNLYQQLERLGAKVKVIAHDKIDLKGIHQLNPQKIIISPGPKNPDSSEISLPAISEFYQTKPILGVCLGHQCIGQLFGSKVISAKKILHGKTSTIEHTGENLFAKVPRNTVIARYHSLVIDSVPHNFKLSAWTKDQEIMAITHQQYPLYGIQFHPESFLTKDGDQIIKNFLDV